MKKYAALPFIAALVLFFSANVTHASGFTIKQGWNLVSFGVVKQLESAGLESFFSEGGAIFTLNPADHKYYGGSSTSALEKGNTKMFETHPSGDDYANAWGLWVYSAQGRTLAVDFTIALDDVADYKESYHLYPGWNLVGITGVMLGKSIGDMRGSCHILSAYVFEGDAWHKQTEADLREKVTQSSFGHAFAMKVANDCAFSFGGTSGTPQVPNLPE